MATPLKILFADDDLKYSLLLKRFLEKEGYELYSSEFVKEGKDWFLRIYIDKPEGEGYIGTEDCEKVSRFLSEKLDEEDALSLIHI